MDNVAHRRELTHAIPLLDDDLELLGSRDLQLFTQGSGTREDDLQGGQVELGHDGVTSKPQDNGGHQMGASDLWTTRRGW